MGLNLTHKIVNALLPRDYREHVIGDLEERGFRPRDIFSVLPGVWIGALLRANLPWDYAAMAAILGLDIASATRMPYGLAALIAFVFAVAGLCLPDLPLSFQTLFELQREEQRKLLVRLINQARWGFPQIVLAQSIPRIARYFWPTITKPEQIGFVILGICLLVGLGQVRVRRLRRIWNTISPNEAILGSKFNLIN